MNDPQVIWNTSQGAVLVDYSFPPDRQVNARPLVCSNILPFSILELYSAVRIIVVLVWLSTVLEREPRLLLET